MSTTFVRGRGLQRGRDRASGSRRRWRRLLAEQLEDRSLLAVLFAAPVDYPAGTYPNSVAVGDFNGDGRDDLATAHDEVSDSSVSVLLNDGDGTFGSKADYTVGGWMYSVVAGDFNGDGRDDLATANSTYGAVSVLLNNGGGTFGSKTNYTVGSAPVSVAVGDFNGDGQDDLVAANLQGNSVSVLLNNGDGTFGTKTDYAVGTGPISAAVGDFNGDGWDDLATANRDADSVSVLLNNGDGTFGPKTDFAVGVLPFSVTVGDFDGDGRDDLAAANRNADSVSVLLNNGDGSFGPKTDYAVGSYPYSVAAGDFNGDGRADLATANMSASGVSVLLNNGDGTFGPKTDYLAAYSARWVAVGDFNGDGQADLAATKYHDASVSVLLNTSGPVLEPIVHAGPDAAMNEGGTFAAIGSFVSFPGHSWTATVDYGDGSGIQSLPLNPDQTFQLSHSFADDGIFTVVVAVADNSTGMVGTDAVLVTMHNVAPTATLNAPTEVAVGSLINVSLTDPFDPSSADTASGFEYAFDFGSGYDVWISSSTASYTPADDGTVTVNAKIRDKDGGETDYTATVTVNDVLPLPDLDGTLGGLIDYILATFNGATPSANLELHSGDSIPGTEETIPHAVQIGQVPAALGDSSELQLDNLALTFPTSLEFDSGTNTWSGGVGVTAIQGALFPGLLDIGIVDDAFDNPRRVKTATINGQQPNGNYEVVFTVAGDHRDLGDHGLFPSNEIAVLNSNPATFNDLDLADDTKQIVFTNVSFDEGNDETDVTVVYNFDPGNSWTGGGLLAALDPDIDDDGDSVGVSGTIQLAPGDANSILKFNALEAADIGFPRWLDIRIEGLQMEFRDFRMDDSDNMLRLNASLRGFETGNFFVNQAIRNNPLLKLNVTGTVSGIEFDMDKLAEGTVDYGVVTLPKNPITNLSGISGEISGSIFGVGSVQAGFIVKAVSVDANGAMTTQESAVAETTLYGAVRGSLAFAGTNVQVDDGTGGTKTETKGAFSAGFNFAISQLGFLQYFVFSSVNIPLEPFSGLAITELRGGLRLNANIEDLQIRPPIGTLENSGQVYWANDHFDITLTTTGHNLKVGDEFRIINAGNSNYNSGTDNFVVKEVNDFDIVYEVETNPGVFTTADIRKMTISDPLDLRDPGFASSKNLSLSDWESQLDVAVVNQMNAGDSVWDALFDKAVIEAGASLSFAPRIPDNVLRLDADLLFDTEGRFLATGRMNLLSDQVSIPAKLYADFSEVTQGATSFLFLADLPEVQANPHDVKPLLVARAGATFEALVGGMPATLDEITGLPSGVGIDVSSAGVADLSGTGVGPWDVTYTLDLANADASDVFAVGDSVIIVNSDPATFDGTHVVRAINNVNDTITVRIGTKVIDGKLDVDLDNDIDSDDDGVVNGIRVIDGALDINGDKTIDGKDNGEVFTVVAGVLVGYAVIDGRIDVDGDGDVSNDADDDGLLGRNPGTLTTGGVAANLDDLGDGFRISLGGGIDVNIPFVTTVTLEGSAQLDFTVGTGDTDARIDLAFDAALSESNVGTIAQANGAFHVTIDANLVDAGDDSGMPEVEIWGAAILDTDFGFLESVGLFANAEGLLRINSSKEAKPDEVLRDVDDNPVPVALPAESFALRLDGSIDFCIDFNGDDTFAESESVFQVGGVFVLEFSAEQGFNVAIFDEDDGQIVAAGLTLGPKNSPLVEFGVLGFLAIRSDGIAADLVLTTDMSLPLGLASINATAVFIVNTTGEDVVFEIPGGATDPNRPTGLSLTIPDAAPANPSGILNHSQSDGDLQTLITGNPTWEKGSAGPYGVVFLAGELDLLSVLELDVSGYVLLSEDVVSLEANFSAAGNFFNLASASTHGTLFFSSQGEFVVDVGGNIQLGPDGFNISGSANLEISHLDSDGRGSQGDGHFVLDIHGSLAVSVEIFYIDVGSVSVDVAYNSSSGVITVGIAYPEPYWAKSCWSTWLGRVCAWYPSVRTATYTFEVGKLTVDPPVLGRVDGAGVLTLNVGPLADARQLAVSQVNEDVVIDDVSAGSQAGRKISVTMFGLTQTFDNVTRVVADMGIGNDRVKISAGVETVVEVHLGDGEDRLENAGSAAVIAYGDEGNDQLNGGSANEQLFGGPGDDVIAGGGGQDLMVGGPGADQFIVDIHHLALQPSSVDGGTEQDQITIVGDSTLAQDLRVEIGDNAGTIASYSNAVQTGLVTFANMESIMLSNGGDQESQDQGFVLWTEGDVVVGGTTADDEITVSPGSAIFTINDDSSTFSSSGLDRIHVYGQDGNDTIMVADTILIPCVLLGDSGNDIIQGGSDNNVIYGGSGNDILIGGSGSNLLSGEDGDDWLTDGGGTNTLIGGSGSNVIVPGGGTNVVESEPGSTIPEVFLDSYVVDEDTQLAPSVTSGVLANDVNPPESDPLMAVVVAQPTNGSLALEADGSFVYTPYPDFHGMDEFSYKANNGADSSVTTAKINVVAVADEPTLAVADACGDEGSDIALNIAASLTDEDGSESLAIQIAGVPASATLSAGTDHGGGVWVLEPQDLPGLTISRPDDGEFTLDVTATAKESANQSMAEVTRQVLVDINNVAPTVGPVSGLSVTPFPAGTEITASADFLDPGTADTHVATWHWGDGQSTSIDPVINSVSGSHTYDTPGVFVVTLVVTDDDGGADASVFEYAVCYDANAGFVTGGGWIMSPAGAYTAEPDLTGKANFGFVSKYKKGADVPTGQTNFQFKTGALNFVSGDYQWLVIAGANAKYKGTGTLNGEGNYGFMLTATDGQYNGGQGDDTFRIKIWDTVDESVIYDNKLAAEDDSYEGTILGGGSIVVHQNGSSLMAAYGAQSQLSGILLTDTILATARNAALTHWQQAGADASQIERLRRVSVLGASLNGDTLGLASNHSDLIWIDRDAAGFGWSPMGQPTRHCEMDLLSTITHEFGHILRLDHNVMSSTLAPSQRSLPSLYASAAHVARIDHVFDSWDRPLWDDHQQHLLDRNLLASDDIARRYMESTADADDRDAIIPPDHTRDWKVDAVQQSRPRRSELRRDWDIRRDILEEEVLDELAKGTRFSNSSEMERYCRSGGSLL